MIKDLVLKNRSYRRFYQDFAISEETLRGFVDLARLSPSSMNIQMLKFILSWENEKNSKIFPYLAWARYLTDWAGPEEGERPSAYIIILGDRRIRENFSCDHGICALSILLGVTELGLGGCMIGNIDKNGLRESLEIPDYFEILLVIALGKPKEVVIIEPLGPDGDIKYYRDSVGKHHVPKRSLDDIIVDL